MGTFTSPTVSPTTENHLLKNCLKGHFLRYLARLIVKQGLVVRVKRTLETDRFEAQSDPGKIYTIIEETQQTGRISKGVTEWEDGEKSYRIMDNGYANRLSETTFHNSRTGETLTRTLRD